MNRFKKFLFYFLFVCLSLVLSFFYLQQKPRLELFFKNYAESMSLDKNIPFEIEIERASLSLFPLQLELYNSRLKPKKRLGKFLTPFKVKKLTMKPRFIDLLIGKFWIRLLEIDETHMDIEIPDQNLYGSGGGGKVKSLNLNNILKRIPISEINIRNIGVNLDYAHRYSVKLENLNLNIFNQKTSIMVSVQSPDSSLKSRHLSEEISFLADTQFLITGNSFFLSKLKLVKEESYFLASGTVFFKDYPGNVQDVRLQARVKSNLGEFNQISRFFYKLDGLERLKGDFKTDFLFLKSGKETGKTLTTKVELKKFQIDQIKLGDFSFSADILKSKIIRFKDFKAVLMGGNSLSLKGVHLDIGEKIKFKTDVFLEDFQVYSFLKQSGITSAPAWLRVSGLLRCEGHYKKGLDIQCPGKLSLKDIQIKNDGGIKNIVSAKNFEMVGSLAVTDKNVIYQAYGKMNQTKISSDGLIDYKKGFKINYQFQDGNFSDFGKLAGFKLAGRFNCSGKTEGNSQTAVFDTELNLDDFVIQDYFLGRLKTRLSYKAGTLYFKNLKGEIGSTRYGGRLSIDLLRENLKGEIGLPFLKMKNVRKIFVRKVDIENKLTGSGSGQLLFDTSFDTRRLNFILSARLFEGQSFGEDYSEASIKAQSVDGIIIIQKGHLKRKKTNFYLKGTIDDRLRAKLVFNGKTELLEQSSLIRKYEIPVSGQLGAKGEITGPLNAPDIKVQSQIDGFVYNEKNYGTAFLGYDNSDKQTRIDFKIKNQLNIKLLFPMDSPDEIVVNARSENFDTAPFLTRFLTKEALINYRFESSLDFSGKINKKNFWNSEFSLNIEKLSLQYRENKVNMNRPFNFELRDKQISMSDMNLSDEDQFIKLTQTETDKMVSKLILSGTVNVAFFKILLPFAEKMSGLGSFRTELDIDKKRREMVGSLYLTGGFLKFPGWPHPLENMSGNFIFNEKRLIIDSVSGQMAEGEVMTYGRLGFGDKIKVDIKGDMKDVNIAFPEDFKTQGYGSISFSGTGPFLLSGNYMVTGGVIENSFNSERKQKSLDLLGELLKKETESPVMIDINIKTENSVEIKNNLVDGYIRGDITIFDELMSPRVKGEASFDNRNTLIRFSDNEFEVVDSIFLFDGQTPVNPKLSLRAKNRVNGYDVELFLKGRADKPVITATSHPPLPENQIIALLTLGTLPQQFEQNNSVAGAGEGGRFEVGTSLLNNNPLGRELKERLDVDIQFSSAFDDQNNVAVPKVTIRKKITKKLQISVSQTSGQANQSEGRVSYDLNNQLSTIFRVNNFGEQAGSLNNPSLNRQNNPVGLDLEYRLEFD